MTLRQPLKAYAWMWAALSLFFVLAIFVVRLPEWFDSSDVWAHVAAIRELMAHSLHPANPIIADPATSPHYSPLNVVAALTANAFGLSPLEAQRLIGLLTMALLPVGIWLFFKSYFRDPVAPVFGTLALLFVWGVPWNWTGFYNLRSLTYNATYPSNFVFAGTFFLLWITVRLLHDAQDASNKRRLLLGSLAVLAWTLVLSHTLSGLFAVGAAGLLAIADRTSRVGRKVNCLLALILGSIASELWPYFSTFTLLLPSGAMADPGWRWSVTRAWYDFREVGALLGPMVVGIPIAVYLFARRLDYFILPGLAAMLLMYSLDFWYIFSLGHRFLAFAIFFLHLAIVAGAIELYRRAPTFRVGTRRRFQIAALAAVGAIILWQCAFVARDLVLWGYWRAGRPAPIAGFERGVGFTDIVGIVTPLASVLPADAVIITDTSWLDFVVPAFRGKSIAAERQDDPFLKSTGERMHGRMTFLAPNTPADERARIITRYGVTNVILNDANSEPELRAFLETRATAPPTRVANFTVYAVR